MRAAERGPENAKLSQTEGARRLICPTTVRIGISGRRYTGWRGVFYPKNLPRIVREPSIQHDEVNGTFCRLQRPENFAAWYDASPKGFCFAIKGSRFITRMKPLWNVQAALANFFASLGTVRCQTLIERVEVGVERKAA